jgi:hypothetical protein
MGCIDLYSPSGDLLSIRFMLEQIWLTGRGDEMHVTELYDLLLVSDERPIRTLNLLLPHFCRSRNDLGGWTDHIALLVPSRDPSGWGWFYDKEEVRQNDVLKLQIPDPNQRNFAHEGSRLPSATIDWHPELTGNKLTVMQEIKKSLYVLDLGRDIRGDADEPIWLRLIVQPRVLDLPADCTFSPGSNIVFKTEAKADAFVTCPALVRRKLLEVLETIEHESQEGRTSLQVQDIHAVRDLIVTRGFRSDLAAPRIEDHRLILIGYDGLQINPRQCPGALDYAGSQAIGRVQPRVSPPFSFKRKRHESPLGHFYLGGAVQQSNMDLVAVVNGIMHEAGYGEPKSQDTLARTITSAHYREGCFLIDRMIEMGLLEEARNANGADRFRKPSCEAVELHRRICALRRYYQDRANFVAFDEAQSVFRDMHPFRLDFSAHWKRGGILRTTMMWIIGVSGVISLLIHFGKMLWQVLRR